MPLLILVGRLLGEAMLRMKQPAVMGQLIAGLILGPSLFGALFPDLQHMIFPAAKEQKAMLDGIAHFGILMLLLLTGMETDLKLVRESGKASVTASLTGIVIPFLCGVALGEALPDSCCPIRQAADHLAVPRHRAVDRLGEDRGDGDPRNEFHAPHRRPGDFRFAIIDDTVGWMITAVIFSLALQGHVDAWSVAQSVVGTLAFMAAEPDGRPPRGVLHHPLGQRHLRVRLCGHHRHPADHGRHGA